MFKTRERPSRGSDPEAALASSPILPISQEQTVSAALDIGGVRRS